MNTMQLSLQAMLVLALLAAGCATVPAPEGEAKEANMGVVSEVFGVTPEGEEVQAYTLTNANGMEAKILTFGAIVQSLKVPNRDGVLEDVVLGFDTLDGYVGKHPYFGAIVGRYGNRIAKGKFTLDGVEYTLAINNDANALHGGLKGFDKQVWSATPTDTSKGPGVTLEHVSADGTEGYPGTLTTTVTYLLTNENALEIHYTATTDAPTVLNVTNHSYFNLKGAGNGNILDHEVMINADHFTPVDETLIPTGELQPVEGTPFDFRAPKPIGRDIAAQDAQIVIGGGYDHNFVLNQQTPGELSLAARIHEPESGRVMEVLTTEPGMQFYTGNFLDSTNTGKGGIVYAHRFGFCMETQHFPDSPNQPQFPSVVLRPGEEYKTMTVYKFSVDGAE